MVYNQRYQDAHQFLEEIIEKLTKAQSENVSLAWFACVAATAHDQDEGVQPCAKPSTTGIRT